MTLILAELRGRKKKVIGEFFLSIKDDIQWHFLLTWTCFPNTVG